MFFGKLRKVFTKFKRQGKPSKKKQARKAHSSAFCIDLHRQTLMEMMGNDDNEGNDVIEDIDVFRTCHILLPYPDTSANALAPYPYP